MAHTHEYGLAENTADMLTKLCSFLTTTAGWTLLEDQMSAATPYFVVHSTGESGREDIYLQFVNDSRADAISVHGGLFWDGTNKVMIRDAYSSGYTMFLTKDSVQFLYWLYASLDRVVIVTKLVSYYYVHYSGLVRRFYSDDTTTTRIAIAAGSNVVVPVNDASIFTSGSYYMIRDNANIERCLVTAVDSESSPNTITIATLANAYSLGATIGMDPQPVIIGRDHVYGGGYMTNSVNGSPGSVSFSTISAATNNADPEMRSGRVVLFPVLVIDQSTNTQELRGELSEVYGLGSGAGASEDLVQVDSITYKVFCSGSSSQMWVAIREA